MLGNNIAFGCFLSQSGRLHTCACAYAWMYAWVCESRTTIQPPGLRVLTPIFQLLYWTLNPVNLLLFTLSPSSCSLCLYLSLSHTLMLIYSPSISLSCLLYPSPSSSLQSLILMLSHSLVFISLFSCNSSSISLYNGASVYLPLQIKPYSDPDSL